MFASIGLSAERRDYSRDFGPSQRLAGKVAKHVCDLFSSMIVEQSSR